MRRCTRVLILDADTQRMTYYHLRIRVASLVGWIVDIYSLSTRAHTDIPPLLYERSSPLVHFRNLREERHALSGGGGGT